MNSTKGIPMDIALPLTPSRAVADSSTVEIPQYSRRAIAGIWAAAALPMAAFSWLVAPALADHLSGEGNVPLVKALLATLTAGLVWQFVLVAVLVAREQRTLRWTTVREALWLRSPRSPRSGRVGGRMWLVVIPLVIASGVEALLASGVPVPASRDLSAFLDSHVGHAFLSGNWAWFAIVVAMALFNTVLGEELLFRGFLLPRMKGAFGRGDWIANGLLFTAYHLHMPWEMPTTLLDTFILAYPSKRYRSAWIGIAVHSAQSVVIIAAVLALVI
jgi:uncharacterized protein